MNGSEIFHFDIDPSAEQLRLDQYLALQLPDASRSHLARLIREGRVTVHGKPQKPSYRLRAFDTVDVEFPEPKPIDAVPEDIPLDIRYEDDTLIVINKPPGLVVHPGPGHTSGTLVNGLLYHCTDLSPIGGALRPGIVHRLDRDTSGTIVVAKTGPAHENLSRQFKERLVKKRYLALVAGRMPAREGRIDFPLGRHPTSRKKMSIRSRAPREAETRWCLRREYDGASLLEVNLMTGRTHQIRVHCAAIQRPILGDAVYGSRITAGRNGKSAGSPVAVPRQMLHAWRLGFIHPANGEWMQFASPLPDDMVLVLRALAGKTVEG
jgi:23S rRNA pseudouridine1911/1915/1917 synthase